MKKIIYILFIILTVSLSACQSSRPVSKLEVELSEYAITPDHYIVQAGKQITIHVVNVGSMDHDYTIENFGVDIGDTFDYEDQLNNILQIKVRPGQEATASFQVPDQAGIYRVACSLPGHLQAGMRATLEVVP